MKTQQQLVNLIELKKLNAKLLENNQEQQRLLNDQIELMHEMIDIYEADKGYASTKDAEGN